MYIVPLASWYSRELRPASSYRSLFFGTAIFPPTIGRRYNGGCSHFRRTILVLDAAAVSLAQLAKKYSTAVCNDNINESKNKP